QSENRVGQVARQEQSQAKDRQFHSCSQNGADLQAVQAGHRPREKLATCACSLLSWIIAGAASPSIRLGGPPSFTCAVAAERSAGSNKESNTSIRTCAQRRLENLVSVPQVPKRPDVRDDEGHAKLIFRAHVAEIEPAVLERQPATTPVITGLHDLVL